MFVEDEEKPQDIKKRNPKIIDTLFILSKIITDTEKIQKLEKLFNKKYKSTLIFRGTDDGFEAEAFHKKCDNQGETLTIIKSGMGKIFGGYTDIPW